MTEKTDITNETAETLRKYIEAIESYEAQKKDLNESIKEIFDNAKANGFDVKTMRKVIALRKMDKAKLEEQEYLLETYKEALGLA